MKIEYEKYILPVGLAIAGYLVLKNLGVFGSAANADNNAALATTTAAGVASTLQAAKSSGDKATLSAAQASGLAATIFDSYENQDTLTASIMQAKTLTDLLLIIQAFGTKQASTDYFSTCNWLGFNCQSFDLGAWLNATLDQAHLNQVNNYLIGQGINYQF